MSKQPPTDREESGKLLQNNVKRINPRNYEVKSATSNKIYKIYTTSIGWVCSCPDHEFRGLNANISTQLNLVIH